MINKATYIGLTVSLLGLIAATGAQAQTTWNKKTVLTFSQPVEVPGFVLPAGTYTFKLADSPSDRHIVQIFKADTSEIIATIMAIPDYRMTATDKTVIKFSEVPMGSPEAIRGWFYPGDNIGQAFVYPKSRATQLAKAAKAVVPAIATDVTDLGAMKTAPIVAITPDEKEVPVAAAIQTTPPEKVAMLSGQSLATGTTGITPPTTSARRLPKTASALPLIALLGFGSIGVGLGLMAWLRRAPAATL